MAHLLLADDHEIVRCSLRDALENHHGWKVVGEASNGKEAIQRTIALKPDVAIVDYSLPLINGVEVTRQIRQRAPSVEVLAFTMHDQDTLMKGFLHAGARGYVLKTDAQRHLYAAVEALIEHQPYLTNKASEVLLQAVLGTCRAGDSLIGRDRAIVQLIAEGLTNKEMASTFGVSVKSIEIERAAVMRKLGLTSSAALVRYAVRQNIVEP